MTWKTHSQGIPFSTTLIMPVVLYQLGSLELDVFHYTMLALICWVLVFNCARQGSIFPDLDHHAGSIPQKSTLNIFLNKMLHFVFRGKMKLSHRSWQTHSMDLYAILCGVPAIYLYKQFLETSDIIFYLASIMLIAFMTGAIIHCFMDCYTTKGVWVSIIIAYIFSLGRPKGTYMKFRVKLAPTWFWYFKVKRVNSKGKPTLLPRLYKHYPITNTSTGGDYEDNFRKIVIQFNKLFIIITIVVYTKSVILPLL